jgi:diguanylate cyclase (GGDEF)-like protein/PAS domain S-box-containing protein
MNMLLMKGWFAHPSWEGAEEKNRIANLLDVTILLLLLYTLSLFLSRFVGGKVTTGGGIAIAITFVVSLFMRFWLFRGKVYFVGAGLTVLGIFSITLSLASSGTVRSPILALYLFPVIMGGILYGLNGILAMNIVSSLIVAGLMIAENVGLLPPPDHSVTITQWITYTFFLWLASHYIYYAYQTTVDALNHAKKEIAERKLVERNLRESDERWQFALEGAGDGIWDWNAQTNQAYYSHRWKAMLGFEPDEIGDTLDEWDKRIHPDDRENTYFILNRHLAGETEIYICEHRLRCKDGNYKWILDRGKVIERTPDGKPLRVMGTHTDVTQRKNIENSLRDSEARFRSLFDQNHDAVFILDFEGNHLAANQRAAEMFGYTVDEVIRLSLRDVSAELGESLNVLADLLAGKPVPLYERLFRKKGGQIFPVEINAELVRDSEGNPLHIQSVVRDISQRKQDEEALKILNQQLSLQIAEVEQLQIRLREQALHDPLTGLYNRYYLSEMLGREFAQMERESHHLSIIISDVDHFKVVNDTYGHHAGDKLLVEIASLFVASTRSSDIACRYGGEEFLLILPGTPADVAALRAEKLRQKCAELCIQHEGQNIRATVSFGVASYPDHGNAPEEILIKADKALYQSKKSGRNRVTIWE